MLRLFTRQACKAVLPAWVISCIGTNLMLWREEGWGAPVMKRFSNEWRH